MTTDTDSSRENGQWKGPEAGASLCVTERVQMACGQKALGKREDRRSKAAGKTFSSGALGERDSMGDQKLVGVGGIYLCDIWQECWLLL